MTKQEILQTLKAKSGLKTVRLPRDLNLTIVDGCLNIEVPGASIYENMQKDGTAFEGWALVLYRWLDEVKHVKISWQLPKDASENQMQHYQRLLFRAKKFSDAYSWVDIDPANKGCFTQWIFDSEAKFIVNIPSKLRSRNFNERKELAQYTESQLEEFILSTPEVLKQFQSKLNLKHVDNQLPVGVFNGKKSNATKIFTGGKSAIDIWGINNDDEICLFELKTTKNNKVGALTEMLFYSFFIQNVSNKKFEFHQHNYLGLDDITNAKGINSYLLAPNSHPLLDSKVFSLMNMSNSGIHYGNVIFDDKFKFRIL